jgi:hypothetical protein
VAGLSTQDAALVLDAELAARYGKSTGTAFAGIVAGPNKVMRRVARRDLVTWDSDARGYRMDPADAAIVLQRWPVPSEVAPVVRQTKRRDGDAPTSARTHSYRGGSVTLPWI